MMIDKFKYKLHGRFRGRKKINSMPLNELKEYQINFKKDINLKNYNILDIGSGSGENAICLSANNLKAKIITCEVFEDGNLNLCNQIIKNKITNIRLFQGNVLHFLDELEPTLIFDEIWILFPDPWPKTRHHKRRLINSTFIKKIYSYHKFGGRIKLASDSQSYINSIVNTLNDTKEIYSWENQRVNQWNYGGLLLPRTKFYKKAEKSNRNSMFFELKKI